MSLSIMMMMMIVLITNIINTVSINIIRSTIGERSFPSAAASMWNALPRSVRSSTSVLQSRRRLKAEN